LRAPIRPGALVLGWLLITIVGVAVVVLAIGPISEERDQRALLDGYRAEIDSATNQAFGLGGIEVPTQAPAPGTAVGILDIEAIGLSRVVVEGVAPEHTRQGPGHVVGTGGLGQPGNSVVVGRRALYGGAFAGLDLLVPGDRILVTTTQGRSVYVVSDVGTHAIGSSDGSTSASTSTTVPPEADLLAEVGADPDAPDEPVAGEEPAAEDGEGGTEGQLTSEEVFGPSDDDRLTLVTAASGAPVAGDAVVVVATMESEPFQPTPQGGRTPGADGRSGTDGLGAALVLALLAYIAAVVGAVWLHRNVPWRSAYLLSAPVLVALTIVLAEELVALLPAWT
jgi:sortase A